MSDRLSLETEQALEWATLTRNRIIADARERKSDAENVITFHRWIVSGNGVARDHAWALFTDAVCDYRKARGLL